MAFIVVALFNEPELKRLDSVRIIPSGEFRASLNRTHCAVLDAQGNRGWAEADEVTEHADFRAARIRAMALLEGGGHLPEYDDSPERAAFT